MVHDYTKEYIENVENLVDDSLALDYSDFDKVNVYRRESVLGDPGLEVTLEVGGENYSFQKFYDEDEVVDQIYDEVVEEFGSLFSDSMVFGVKANDGFRSVNLV